MASPSRKRTRPESMLHYPFIAREAMEGVMLGSRMEDILPCIKDKSSRACTIQETKDLLEVAMLRLQLWSEEQDGVKSDILWDKGNEDVHRQSLRICNRSETLSAAKLFGIEAWYFNFRVSDTRRIVVSQHMMTSCKPARRRAGMPPKRNVSMDVDDVVTVEQATFLRRAHNIVVTQGHQRKHPGRVFVWMFVADPECGRLVTHRLPWDCEKEGSKPMWVCITPRMVFLQGAAHVFTVTFTGRICTIPLTDTESTIAPMLCRRLLASLSEPDRAFACAKLMVHLDHEGNEACFSRALSAHMAHE